MWVLPIAQALRETEAGALRESPLEAAFLLVATAMTACRQKMEMMKMRSKKVYGFGSSHASANGVKNTNT